MLVCCSVYASKRDSGHGIYCRATATRDMSQEAVQAEHIEGTETQRCEAADLATTRSAESVHGVTCSVSCHRTTPAESSGRRLFLGGLPWNTTQEYLLQHFAQIGEVEEAVSCLSICCLPSCSLLVHGRAWQAGLLLPLHICVAML